MAEVRSTNNESDTKEQTKNDQSSDTSSSNNQSEFIIVTTTKPLSETYFAPQAKQVPPPPLLGAKNVFGEEYDILDNFVITKNQTKPSNNFFINTLHLCFMYHLPLILRPDDLWLQILQGLSIHISENKNKLQTSIVNFADPNNKIKIMVQNDNLTNNSINNSNNSDEKEKEKENNNINWKLVLNKFDQECNKICAKTNKDGNKEITIMDWGLCNFSTSNQITKIASQCCLFSVLANYVSFYTMTSSGIPKITLKGKIDDWKLLYKKCQYLKDFQCNFWYKYLMKVMDNIIKTVQLLNDNKIINSENNQDLLLFWESIYHFANNSGGATVTGWCNILCPYLYNGKEFKINHEMKKFFSDNYSWGIHPWEYPSSYTKAPMTWNYLGNEMECDMVGGIVGIQQNKNDGGVAPIIGWIIKES